MVALSLACGSSSDGPGRDPRAAGGAGGGGHAGTGQTAGAGGGSTVGGTSGATGVSGVGGAGASGSTGSGGPGTGGTTGSGGAGTGGASGTGGAGKGGASGAGSTLDGGGTGGFDGGHPAVDAATADGSAVGDGGRCPVVPRCDAAAPDPGQKRAWRHNAPSSSTAGHRGRDLFLNPGAPQWIIANFQYGLAVLESALQDEEVDIYLLRGCGATWETLGTTLTTATPGHPKVEGVDDAAGRIFFEIPPAKALGPGRHRIHLVVGGDLTTADMFIEVVAPGTPTFVSDMDGTLTTSENAQTIALLTGAMPAANPEAPEALSLLASKGYRPMYLTARPEWLVKTTQDWIVAKGFPPGIVHTTLVSGGASGAAAATFKTEELRELEAKGLKPTFVFGNTSTDADAYNNAAIQPLTNRIFFQYTDTAWNGRRIEAYGPLLSEFATLFTACR